MTDVVESKEMNDIEKEAESDVVSTGTNFMQAITKWYGAEKGMLLWEDIVKTLPEVKGKIFINMLSGAHSGYRTIEILGPTGGLPRYGSLTHMSSSVSGNIRSLNKVAAIKAIRSAAQIGLKEAKDLIDASENRGSSSSGYKPVNFKLAQDSDRAQVLRELYAAGYDAR